jgi:GR25 family glycosyltransferase involved in LPS biosynthesis
MNTIDKIFVIHYSPLTERKEHLTAEFRKYGIANYEFFEEYNRNTVSRELMSRYYKLHRLTPAQICISIAHIEIYRQMVEKNYSRVLILEDDALLADNFLEKFNHYMTVVPSDFDMLFLNDGCGMHAPHVTPEKIWYLRPSTRTCCSYIISKAACEKILPTIIPFTKVIDHELNTQIALHKLHVYWCEPTIVSDGSETCYAKSYTPVYPF